MRRAHVGACDKRRRCADAGRLRGPREADTDPRCRWLAGCRCLQSQSVERLAARPMPRAHVGVCDEPPAWCYGVDISPRMVDLARSWNQGVRGCEFIVNDRAHLGLFADGHIDFVYTRIV